MTQTQADQKIVQYLTEAQAMEQGLVSVLQSQIAMAPRGSYRKALEAHLTETRSHAQRVQKRLAETEHGSNLLALGIGVAESVVAQALALSKTPFDLLRGSGGEEKVLKNAKDACATEALEIATYAAIEQLAHAVDDEQTAALAASIRADEEKMLDRLMIEVPKLTDAVVEADLRDRPSYEVSKTGAADTVRDAGAAVKALSGQEPWPGYDKQNVSEIRSALEGAEYDRLASVRSYERSHKNRTGVLELVARERVSA